MPVPKPNNGENQNDYMNRCITYLINEGKDNEQAVAICLSTWNENKTQKTHKLKYTAKQLKADKKGAINEKMMETITKNKKGLHIATKADIAGDNIKAVANTFNFFDYDADILTPGSVDQTLKNREIPIYHLKDHKFTTDGIIGSIKNTYVDKVDTLEFGAVDALIFESVVKGFPWYKENVISQHSIGFRYEEIVLAIMEDNGSQEEKIFSSYIDNVINKEEAIEAGYFYLVTKINLFEISAVLRGANRLTSVLKSNDLPKNKTVNELLNGLNFRL